MVTAPYKLFSLHPSNFCRVVQVLCVVTCTIAHFSLISAARGKPQTILCTPKKSVKGKKAPAKKVSLHFGMDKRTQVKDLQASYDSLRSRNGA
ncbi:hypothetical protein ScPMuIL_007532 [Solemya velum]